MIILTWTILKKTQILNGCETFAFKYIKMPINNYFMGKGKTSIYTKNQT